MTRTLAEYLLDDGTSVFVEAEAPEDDSEERVSIFGGPKTGARPSWGAAVARITPALEEVGRKIASISLRPDEVNIEVGIKFVGEAGVVVARTATEANLVIKMKWISKSPETAGGKDGDKAAAAGTASASAGSSCRQV
jgi:hypothetical protein